jgi:hypothetical protein
VFGCEGVGEFGGFVEVADNDDRAVFVDCFAGDLSGRQRL